MERYICYSRPLLPVLFGSTTRFPGAEAVTFLNINVLIYNIYLILSFRMDRRNHSCSWKIAMR